jgi:hypothetical protein
MSSGPIYLTVVNTRKMPCITEVCNCQHFTELDNLLFSKTLYAVHGHKHCYILFRLDKLLHFLLEPGNVLGLKPCRC